MKKKKKEEEKNKYHKEYGAFHNLAYIARRMYRYDKMTALVIALAAVCTPVAAYLWTFMSKFVIDVVTRKDDSEKLLFINLFSHLKNCLLVTFLSYCPTHDNECRGWDFF